MPYFDHNATAPLRPEARDAWLEASEKHWRNPSSPYRSAARVRNALEEARQHMAELLGCPPEQLIFTSGATEANNAVLRHFANRRQGATAAIAAIEHPSVLEPAQALFPGRLLKLQVTGDGVLDIDAVREQIEAQKPDVVSVMAANNEMGALQPWEELAAYCRARGIPFHCDAVQWIGRKPLDGLSLCDYVTCSAHKFGGPKGVGFLVVPGDDRGFHSQRGGSQEQGYRGGTENYPAIAAMRAALDAILNKATASACLEQAAARDAFEQAVLEAIPGTRVAARGAPRLWNTSMLILPRFRNRRWVARLDKLGFELSTGSACASGKGGASHVLLAMGLHPDDAAHAVRASGGLDTATKDWAALAEAFMQVWTDLQAEDEDSSASDSNASVIQID